MLFEGNQSDITPIKVGELDETLSNLPNSSLQIIGTYSDGINKKETHRRYILSCKICSEDRELNPSGLFVSYAAPLRRGILPCGCGTNVRWTQGQSEIICKRLANERDYTFISFIGPWKNNKTPVKILCNKFGHGEFIAKSVNAFKTRKGCLKCKTEVTKELFTKSEEYHTNDFIRYGKFLKGTTFWRSSRVSKGNTLNYWEYNCPICSNDEYVKQGLCDGIFEINISSAKVGNLSCRCSKAYRWTKEQREYQINRRIGLGGLPYTFIGWENDNTSIKSSSRFYYSCRRHGKQRVTVTSFINSCNFCPQCTMMTKKYAYINIVKDHNSTPVALKFGITGDYNTRFKNANKRNRFKMSTLHVYYFDSHLNCIDAERYCLNNLTCSKLNKIDMKDGWTETTDLSNLSYIQSVLTNFGGAEVFNICQIPFLKQ